MNLEHTNEGRPAAVQPPPHVVGDRADRDQVGCLEQQLRVSLEDLAA